MKCNHGRLVYPQKFKRSKSQKWTRISKVSQIHKNREATLKKVVFSNTDTAWLLTLNIVSTDNKSAKISTLC